MNIFYLDESDVTCAQYHCDKHCVSQVKEYCQLLSTAHRVLDGANYTDASSGRKIQRWRLDEPRMEKVLYKATHVNHPSAKWARNSIHNYRWLASLALALCTEYTYRYNKQHKCESLIKVLNKYVPKNIQDIPFEGPWRAMPEEFKIGTRIDSYRAYYRGAKRSMATWRGRNIPIWFGV